MMTQVELEDRKKSLQTQAEHYKIQLAVVSGQIAELEFWLHPPVIVQKVDDSKAEVFGEC